MKELSDEDRAALKKKIEEEGQKGNEEIIMSLFISVFCPVFMRVYPEVIERLGRLLDQYRQTKRNAPGS